MSLIETAINKLRSNAPENSPSPPRNSAPVKRVRTQLRAESIDPSSVRQFKRTTTNAQAMERHCLLPHVADQAALRAYRIMRTRVGQRLTANQWTSLIVTGTESGQGKTLTAINLAVALSQDPSTYVFLVDLDLQRPQIGNYMGLQFERGLGDYLMGECPIEEIIYSPGIERLAVVPNSRSIEHSSDFLSSAAMSTFRDTLMNEKPQRIVIYDMPPLLLSDDVITFAPRVDGVVLVATEGFTVRGSLERSKELLAEMNVIGVVLNRSAERNDSAYY